MPDTKDTFLLFDFDRSLATIGGRAGAEEALGLPPVPVTGGVKALQGLLNKVLTRKTVEVDHPIFPDMVSEETHICPNAKGRKLGLSGLVIDTATTLGGQERQQILHQRKQSVPDLDTLDVRGWGLYGDKMMRLWESIASIDLTVIVTAHVKEEKDDLSRIKEVPAMKGGSATGMARFFDVILYNRVQHSEGKASAAKASAAKASAAKASAGEAPTEKSPEGKTSEGKTSEEKSSAFRWQTRASERRPAKDRCGVLPPLMKQDYAEVLSRYASAGVPSPKILCVGESGTGKTHALSTLST